MMKKVAPKMQKLAQQHIFQPVYSPPIVLVLKLKKSGSKPATLTPLVCWRETYAGLNVTN